MCTILNLVSHTLENFIIYYYANKIVYCLLSIVPFPPINRNISYRKRYHVASYFSSTIWNGSYKLIKVKQINSDSGEILLAMLEIFSDF